ncbi:MAG: formate transporter FocA [Actinomycetaceae bacterium]|nr:formate transporter FocA [Actinomycetaceae bacterium]
MPVAAPAEILGIAESGLLKKANTPFPLAFLSAIYAGAFIALGFVFYTTSQVGSAALPYGFAKVVGGIVFSTGLSMVVMTGADLFTSTSMTLMAGVDGKLPWRRLFPHWGVVYLGNFVGALAVAGIIMAAGVPAQAGGGWGATALAVASGKVSHTIVEAFFLGVLCNFMVCVAVWLAFAGRRVVDKIVAITFPIALFVASGFEHSIANMFIIPVGLMVKSQGCAQVLAAAGNPDLTGLTLESFLLGNLLPVTLGNIVGGGIFVGLGMFFLHRDKLGHNRLAG